MCKKPCLWLKFFIFDKYQICYPNANGGDLTAAFLKLKISANFVKEGFSQKHLHSTYRAYVWASLPTYILSAFNWSRLLFPLFSNLLTYHFLDSNFHKNKFTPLPFHFFFIFKAEVLKFLAIPLPKHFHKLLILQTICWDNAMPIHKLG